MSGWRGHRTWLHVHLTCVLASSLIFAGTAGAQYEARAAVEPPVAGATAEDPAAAATVVSARDRPRELERVEDLFAEVPSARVRRLGGLASSSDVALRGAGAEHTTVVLDEVRLGATGVGLDLSLFPADVVDEVEVYRGGAPIWLGEGAIGGVVRLVPRAALGRRASATLGLGSFGRFEARGATEVGDESVAFASAVGLAREDGDHPYLDDGGTLFDPSDDVERTRRNAAAEVAHGFGHARWRLGAGELRAFVLTATRRAGVPGPAIRPTTRARRHDVRAQAAVGWELDGTGQGVEADWRLQLGTAVGLERRRVSDPFGEIGVGRRVGDDRALDATVRAAGVRRFTRAIELASLASWRVERFEPDDPFAAAPPRSATRHLGAAAVEARLAGRVAGVRSELRTSGRLELSLAEGALDAQRATASPTVRIALAVAPVAPLVLAASYARATRQPSLVELFGDGAFVLGDVALRPERGDHADAGATLRLRGSAVRAEIETRGWLLALDDLVRWRRTSQYTVAPENVAHATVLGIEVGSRIEIGRRLAVAAAASALRSEDDRGRALPFRPALQGYARAELRVGPARGWIDAQHLGASFVDPGNLVEVPARTLFGAGASCDVARERLRLGLSITDVFDARGFDLLGFPLAGRTFLATVTYREELGRAR